MEQAPARWLPLDGSTSIGDTAGAGTILYVVDSGVRRAHGDFANTGDGDAGAEGAENGRAPP